MKNIIILGLIASFGSMFATPIHDHEQDADINMSYSMNAHEERLGHIEQAEKAVKKSSELRWIPFMQQYWQTPQTR